MKLLDLGANDYITKPFGSEELLARIGDHAENFHEIGREMNKKGLAFSDTALEDIKNMYGMILQMLAIAKDIFETLNMQQLPALAQLENQVDDTKRRLNAKHFARLSSGNCQIELSPYYTSTVAGLERVADHIVNVGYSIQNPIGSEKETEDA